MAFLYQIKIEPRDAELCGGCEYMVEQDYSTVMSCAVFGGELDSRQTKTYDIQYLRCKECRQAETQL